MSDFSDDELPDVAFSLSLPESPTKSNKVSYKIDLTEEIRLRCQNYKKEQKRLKITEEVLKIDRDQKTVDEKYQRALLSTLKPIVFVPDEAPGREFIKSGTSFCAFNADTLVKPHIIERANNKDFLLFYQHLRNTLQDITANETVVEDAQEILKYVLFLASVHPDELTVECCMELLLEYNSQWEIDHKLLVAIFQNWGADISQALPGYPPAPVRIEKSNHETVPFYNVNSVLQVVSAQLKLRKKIDRFDVTTDFGLWSVDELVFSLLVLLSLDTKYINCIPIIQECICKLLTGVNETTRGSWAADYCQLMLLTETDNYNLTSVVCRILIGSLACETLQLNLCYAALQRIVDVPLNEINYTFDLNKFEWLIRRTTPLAERKAVDIYCLLIFVDTIVRHSKVRSEEKLRSLYQWLMRFQSKLEKDSHVPHVSALISNLATLWDDERMPQNKSNQLLL